MLGLVLALALGASSDPAELELSAERLLHDGQRQLTTAEGHAHLVTDGAAVDADRIVFDRARRVVTAAGHVVARLTQGGLVAIVADVVTLRLDDGNQVREVFLHEGQALAKKDATPEALLAAASPAALARVGRTQALLEGNHLVRDGPRWRVARLELVPCECDFENPSWSISSTSATVDTEADRVSIWNPVVRIKQLPVLWLPWLSLPLSDRQSGLLLPRPFWSQLNGVSYEQPLFLTLGRSADLTLTPGYFAGGSLPFGIAGPRLGAELRYVPGARTSGQVNLGLLYDLRAPRDVADASLTAAGQRGLRGELSWQHAQDLGGGGALRAEVNAHSDGHYNRDLVPDVIASTATSLRSGLVASQRGAEHLAAIDLGLRQDIQWGYDWLGRGLLLRDAERRPRFGPGTLQRLPAVNLAWAPSAATLGPLRFELEAEAVRLAPLFSNTGDEGSQAGEGALLGESFACTQERLFRPTTASSCGVVQSGLGDRRWQPGEREARDRLSVLPRLAFAAQPGGVASVSGFLAWRQLAWLGEASGGAWSRGTPLLGARVESELSRTFGEGAVRHLVRPMVEVRAVPAVLATSSSGRPLVPYDEVDAAVPDGQPRVQAVVELQQRLVRPDGAELLRLELGQGAELLPSAARAELAESYGRISTQVGWLAASAQARVDPVGALLTRLAGRVDLDDRRGHAAWASYENLLLEGTARTRQPLDLLFGRERGFSSVTRAWLLAFGARWEFRRWSVRYQGLVTDRQYEGGVVAPTLLQHGLGVGINPACDCWRLELTATQRVGPRGELLVPDFGASMTLSHFGTIGAGGR